MENVARVSRMSSSHSQGFKVQDSDAALQLRAQPNRFSPVRTGRGASYKLQQLAESLGTLTLFLGDCESRRESTTSQI